MAKRTDTHNRVMTRASLDGVPNQPKTPRRSVRVPTDLWQAAKEKAKRRGETVTDVIIRALKAYVRD